MSCRVTQVLPSKVPLDSLHVKWGQESWKGQLGGGLGHEAVSSAMSTPVLTTQFPSPLWWHTRDCSWVTATNICKGSLQTTRGLQPCKCSWGYPSCRLQPPLDDSCASSIFHIPLFSWASSFSFKDSALESRTVLIIILL